MIIMYHKLISKLGHPDNAVSADAKQKLKAFLAHPLTTGVLGAAAGTLIGSL